MSRQTILTCDWCKRVIENPERRILVTLSAMYFGGSPATFEGDYHIECYRTFSETFAADGTWPKLAQERAKADAMYGL